MSSLPIDLTFALGSTGIDINLNEDDLEHGLRSAIADRHGYLGEITMSNVGY